MIDYRQGDIFTYFIEYDVFVHLANCQHIMGSGVAAGVRRHLPQLYAVDLLTSTSRKKMGSYSQCDVAGVTCLNLYGQYSLSNTVPHIDHDALRRGLQAINLSFSGQKICMPMIGSKRAGGDWSVIEQIIKECLDRCYVTVFYL